jgi:NhaP-type Na+/H+ or K+/H+ antiporter
MYLDLALLAGCALLFSCVAGAVEKSRLTGPIVFVVFGFCIGPLGAGLLSLKADAETLKFLAELTLALVLFIDAAGADLKMLRSSSKIPLRLLLVGLPLTLLLGFGFGIVLFDNLSLIEIALLATIVAPTDAALGQAVVKNETVPEDFRQGLSVESGLNDGICVPVLFAILALALGSGGHGDGGGWYSTMILFAEEIGVGLIVGVVLASLTVYLLRYAKSRHWLTHTWIQIPVIALAITCFASAQFVGGSGFIASFCGGLLFGYLTRTQHEDLLRAAEGTGDTFALITWVLFGSAVLGRSINYLDWSIVGYAMLSLTVIRMLPVYISLVGVDINTEGKLFLGWFGPRGLASIVFGVIVLNAGLPHGDTITVTVAVTVILSIFFHGVSANPWAKALGNRLKSEK